MNPSRLLRAILLSTLVVTVLSACASNGLSMRRTLSESDSALIVSTFLADMPMPPGSQIRDQESVILGGGGGWAGRIGLDNPQSPAEALIWFKDTSPQEGWDLISSTIANTIVMVFQQNDRVATIEIFGKGRSSRATDVIISVVAASNLPSGFAAINSNSSSICLKYDSLCAGPVLGIAKLTPLDTEEFSATLNDFGTDTEESPSTDK
jgi:hypothetical protein